MEDGGRRIASGTVDVFGGADMPCKQPCCAGNNDVNDDARIDIADAITVLSFLFGNGTLVAPDGTRMGPAQTGCRTYEADDAPFPCATPCGN